MSRSDIPDIVIGRLPVYLRALSRLKQENREITSSQELGKRLGISSAQIRKDLSHFGEFGKQGTGYNVESLSRALKGILNVDREWQVALIGVGDLGRAIAHYAGFTHRGFNITHLFDVSPDIIGQEINTGLVVQPLDDLEQAIREHQLMVAMIATPAEAAQEIADKVIEAGIKAILNYAPIVLTVPDNVKVQYIDPVIHLQRMSYYLNKLD